MISKRRLNSRVEFWRKIRDFAAKQMKANADGWIKCHICNNYDFDTPLKRWSNTKHPMIDESECGNCGNVARWRMDAIIPIPLDGPNAQQEP